MLFFWGGGGSINEFLFILLRKDSLDPVTKQSNSKSKITAFPSVWRASELHIFLDQIGVLWLFMSCAFLCSGDTAFNLFMSTCQVLITKLYSFLLFCTTAQIFCAGAITHYNFWEQLSYRNAWVAFISWSSKHIHKYRNLQNCNTAVLTASTQGWHNWHGQSWCDHLWSCPLIWMCSLDNLMRHWKMANNQDDLAQPLLRRTEW